jgi:hypothetical protein
VLLEAGARSFYFYSFYFRVHVMELTDDVLCSIYKNRVYED